MKYFTFFRFQAQPKEFFLVIQQKHISFIHILSIFNINITINNKPWLKNILLFFLLDFEPNFIVSFGSYKFCIKVPITF